jgi:hypothetical protein
VSGRLREIGRGLHARLKTFFDQPLRDDASPIELLQAVLDELEGRVQAAGRGRRVFPYDRVVVRVAQRGADEHAVAAVFATLETRLRDRLAELRCDTPSAIAVSVSVGEPAGEMPGPLLTVDCFGDGMQPPSPVTPALCPTVSIAVIKGQCTQSEYRFQETAIVIGRTAEPTDAFGEVRYNHVAFLEARDGVNETVGRAHARLQLDGTSGHYHLFNEGSSNPTSILRSGRTIRVAPRDPRGVRVHSGDVLQLGRAALRVTIVREP